MARVDDLIERVPDPQLRRELQSALEHLNERRRFGIVFEEHMPETTALPNLAIRPGQLVRLRREMKAGLFRVQSVRGRSATVIAVQPNGEPAASAKAARETQVALTDLLSVKRFGEPIYPVFTSVGSVRAGGARPSHAVINGENFHALQLFSYLYEGQVDCIYVDPPYNTGNRDWKYNNAYVDAKDTWRHSKWLSMMDKRLRIAQRLLKPKDGVLIVTIDEHEVHHLGLLLERIYKDSEYLRHTITIVINPKGTGKYNFARVEEYAFYCVPNTGASVISGAAATPVQLPLSAAEDDPPEDEDQEDEAAAAELDADLLVDEEGTEGDSPEEDEADWGQPFSRGEAHLWELRHARRRGNESSYRHQRKNQFYPIYVDQKTGKVARIGEALLPVEEQPSFKKVDGLTPVWPIDDEGNHRCWRLIPSSMQKALDEGRLVLGKYNERRRTWTLNLWVRKTIEKKLKTVWTDKLYDAGTHGTTLLHKMLGRRGAFPFPKSVYAVRDSLAAVVRNRKNALIVDFFAGSGTTLHATALLNQADGGARRCILVTNNEVEEKVARRLGRDGFFQGDPEFEAHGIFEQATRPRCEAAVTGRRPDGAPIPGAYPDGRPLAAGLAENVEFFRLDYVDPDDVELGAAFDRVHPLLWLAAGGKGEMPGEPAGDVATIVRPESGYAVLLKTRRFAEFRRRLISEPRITHVFLVTDSAEAFAEMRGELPPHLRTTMLYRDYLRTFRINLERFL